MNHDLSIAVFQPDIALNLGNMIRTSACFNVKVHVIEPCGFPFSIKSLKRAAMDYTQIAEISRHNDWQSFTQNIPARKILATTKTNLSYSDFHFKKGDCIILGQESAGVPDYVETAADESITIPMPGGGRSLNVAVSMAIVVSEAIRQLNKANF